MGGFLLGGCAAILIALVAYFGYVQFDMRTGSPGQDASVKIESELH